MFFQILVIAALLGGFVLLLLGVMGIRPNREIQWVPVEAGARSGFTVLGALLLLVGGWWYLYPPNPDVGTTQSLLPADAGFTSGEHYGQRITQTADTEKMGAAEEAADHPDSSSTAPAAGTEVAAPDAELAKSTAPEPPSEVAGRAPAPAQTPDTAAPEPAAAHEPSGPAQPLSPAALALEQASRAPSHATREADEDDALKGVPVIRAGDTRAPVIARAAPASRTPPAPAVKKEVAVPKPAPVEATPVVERDETESAIAPPAERPRTFKPRNLVIHVEDALGPQQVAEHVQVQIEGRNVATLDLDRTHPSDSAAVHLPWPGRLRYRLTGYTEWDDGSREPIDAKGCFEVSHGRRYEVGARAAGGEAGAPLFLHAH